MFFGVHCWLPDLCAFGFDMGENRMTDTQRILNGADVDVTWETIPNVRKVGRYALFGICGFSVGMMAAVLAYYFGAPKDFSKSMVTPVFIVVFMALREMSKQWDAVLQQKSKAVRAKAMETGTAKTEGLGAKHDSAAPQGVCTEKTS
jgi:hypothetical protein